MVNAMNPLADPMGFIIASFIFGIGEDPVGTILKLSVLSSVIIFPFTLMGRKVYSWVEETVKGNHFLILFLTSTITVFIFIIVIRLWYVLMGSHFLAVDLVTFLSGFLLAAGVSFLFAILGDFINRVMHQKWQVPQGLTLYVIDLIVCVVFFVVAIIGIYVYLITLGA